MSPEPVTPASSGRGAVVGQTGAGPRGPPAGATWTKVLRGPWLPGARDSCVLPLLQGVRQPLAFNESFKHLKHTFDLL